MGGFDIYCSKSGLPMRQIYDDKKVIPKEIQKALTKGVFVLDGKKSIVKDYDGYGQFKNNKGETVDVANLMYSGDHKTDIYHKDIEKYDLFILNKEIIKSVCQDQYFDDDMFIEFYKDPTGFKYRLVYSPKKRNYVLKSAKYLEKERSSPAGKVLNPDSMRFVKGTSAVGKMILGKRL